MSDTTHSTDGTASDEAGGGGSVRSFLTAIDRNAERYLIFTFYTYLVFVIIIEVLRRFVLDFSSLWGSRTAIYAYIFLTYLGMSWAVKKRAHIRLDAIFDIVSDRVEGYLYLFSDVVMLLFALYTLNYSIPLLLSSIEFGSTTQALRLNRAFFQAAVPLGFLLFAVRVLQRMYGDFRDVRNGRPVYQGEAIFLDDEEDEPGPETRPAGESTTGGDR